MKLSENKTKKSKNSVIFALKQNEAKWKRIFFALMRKMCFVFFSRRKRNENEMKRKQNEKVAESSNRKGIK
jgi:1-acyl-sn-glycerol-3-phosphate acyltransferase